MGALLPLDSRLIDELEVSLVNEGRRAERMVFALGSEPVVRDALEFLVHESHEAIERLLPSVPCRVEQLGDIIPSGGQVPSRRLRLGW